MSPSAQLKIDQSAEDDAIRHICEIVQKITGIQLGDRQHSMVRSRLTKRLIEVGARNVVDYLTYVKQHPESETAYLVSLLTTHHTFFFREFKQFEYLLEKGLPEIIVEARKRPDKKIRIWSAACSRGQEVYSLALFLDHHLPLIAPDLGYEVYGTDVDAESVALGKNGVYLWQSVKEIPHMYIKNHWARGTGEISEYAKVKSSITKNCRFEQGNLLSIAKRPPAERFDAIFCRNVFIYFDAPTIERITKDLMQNMHPHGFLFVGISETLTSIDSSIQAEGLSVYRHKQTPKPPTKIVDSKAANTPSTPAPVRKTLPDKLRVLCVDDSPSIHGLLKQILKSETGFEIVGTAKHGLEAAAMMLKGGVDVMTLDIHMPEQNGIEYLQKNFGPKHPPVVMLTSVSREDSELALKALQAGAADFVEKPALSNLKEKGDELCSKLRCAYMAKDAAQGNGSVASIEREFAVKPTIHHPETKLRLMIAAPSELAKVAQTLSECQGTQPPTLVLVTGATLAKGMLQKQLGDRLAKKVEDFSLVSNTVQANQIYLGDFDQGLAVALSSLKTRKTSILLFGDKPATVIQALTQWTGGHLIIEDNGRGYTTESLKEIANDCVPYTSFAYMSVAILAKDS